MMTEARSSYKTFEQIFGVKQKNLYPLKRLNYEEPVIRNSKYKLIFQVWEAQSNLKKMGLLCLL